METTDMAVDAVERYLLRLKLALGDVTPAQRDEFVREIRSHIVDRLAHEPGDSEVACQSILQSLGEPEAIAADYGAERVLARTARLRLKLPSVRLRTPLRWAITGIQWFMVAMAALIGYPIVAAFSLTAVLKPFFPHNIGLFLSENGFQIAAFPIPTGRELLGPYYVPFAMIMTVLVLVGTSQLIKWLGRRAQQVKKYL